MKRHAHLLNEQGLPYVPPEYFTYGGELTTHHLYFPRRTYLGRTAVHAAFRAMHTVELPWDGHRLFHMDFEPPEMPDYDFMLEQVLASKEHLSTRLLRELGERGVVLHGR
jgi:hypothetical protein